MGQRSRRTLRMTRMTPTTRTSRETGRLRGRIDALAYKFLVVPLQSERLHDFVPELFAGSTAILDFGCGIGNNAARFDPRIYTGVDVSPARIRQARRDCPGYAFVTIPEITGPAQLPFDAASFDRVLVSLCLHHIAPSVCRAILGELCRVLRPGGMIAGLEPCRRPDTSMQNFWMNLMDGGSHIGDRPYYEKLFASAGLWVETHSLVRNFGFNIWRYTAGPADGPELGAKLDHL